MVTLNIFFLLLYKLYVHKVIIKHVQMSIMPFITHNGTITLQEV